MVTYGHKDGRVVLGALRIVSHGAHKHGSGSNNPDSWGDAKGRKDGSRNGPNNGRDSGHYTLNDYGHIDSADTPVGDHNIPVVDRGEGFRRLGPHAQSEKETRIQWLPAITRRSCWSWT